MTARIGAECSLSKNFKKNCTPNSWRPSRSVFDFIQLLSQSRENSYPVHIHVVTPVDLVEGILLSYLMERQNRIESQVVQSVSTFWLLLAFGETLVLHRYRLLELCVILSTESTTIAK